MLLSLQTRQELTALRNGVEMPGEYTHFMVHWIAFNRAYNELRLDGEENARVMGIGDDLQSHWREIAGKAKTIVGLECIGSDRVPQQTLLRPNRAVKSATIYLRNRLNIKPSFPNCRYDPTFCRMNKVSICRTVNVEPWDRTEMAALLRLVYQVRCNLFHGDKQLVLPDTQTNRDRELVSVATEILDEIFGWLC